LQRTESALHFKVYHNTLCTKYNYTLTRFYVIILSVLNDSQSHRVEGVLPRMVLFPSADFAKAVGTPQTFFDKFGLRCDDLLAILGTA
jgi:hypothetical protein